jgi:pectate lyase
VYFGKVFQQHDGLTDIVRGANHVTASWNRFENHDKNMLIGNSDGSASQDAGKLKVTMHHNRFEGILQRSPRVRFGQVDVYNNHYVVNEEQKDDYYVFGVGISSQLHATDNAVTLPAGAKVGKVLKKWNESPLTAENNYVNGRLTDLIAVHNAEIPAETLQSGAGWTPTLRKKVDSPRAVPAILKVQAGAGKVC